MADYRFFIIVNGRIESPPVAHTCATDGEAILMARQLKLGPVVEVWDGARVVAVINSAAPDAA
jgi:hypothetical protein